MRWSFPIFVIILAIVIGCDDLGYRIETEQRRINQMTEGYELDFTHPVILEGGVVDIFVLHASSDGQPLYLVFDNTLWPTSEKRVRIRLVPSE